MEFTQKPNVNENNALQTYGRNLIDDILKHKIDPVIGRDEEIRRLTEIISRKTKNNPVLIGEPGVGKTAIVEGFAWRIVNNDVPSNLKDMEVYELSLSSLIAGASYQGEFEKRLESVIKQVQKSNGKIILFIDEIHQLVGMGKGQGAMDAANILKPAMARGDIKIIGATTLNEYREYIEKDGALERRMQKIYVAEPTIQETLTIMRGLKEKWELFHKVKIHDSALLSAVLLSDRYITNKFLPDKAIDLIDEAAAKVNTELHSMPAELDKINRDIVHKETERASLLNETDEQSKLKLIDIDNELNLLKEKRDTEEAKWAAHKKEHTKLIDLKGELDESKNKFDRLQADGQYEKASKLMYIEIPRLEKEITALENKIISANSSFRDSVTNNEIAEVISKATGIKLTKLLETEKEKLLNLASVLKLRVRGQDEATQVVADAVLRSKAGINDPKRPIGSFIFLGPTGVGKTELAKALAFSLFDSEKAIIKIDCSELMEEHSVSKLIGSPAGYIGYGDTNMLAEPVRRRPYSIVLFDEIEKAHPKVLNLLLQILDEGVLHDAKGNNVNFKNTIIIMTSNIGAHEIIENKPNEAIIELKKYLKPELINRIDEIITFNSISQEIVKEIVIKILDELSDRLMKDGYDVKMSNEKLINKIIANAYDVTYGARPVKRYIQKEIENFLASQILKNELKKNHPYYLKLDGNGSLTIEAFKID
ncbi:MAG: ATP-dependent Clp protease ATP-binding subunit [Mycoplasmataceae bacterium]|nr:ATP-dependent Clp protease ATP-binding subunit [Mycoplasmataceae bacterium]